MTHTFITTGKLLASSLVIAMAFSSTAMAQAKNSTSTQQTDVDTSQPNATSDKGHGRVYAAVATAGVAPARETPDVGDVTERANINTSRSNRKSSGIAAPSGETTDVGDALPNAISYGSTRSNTKNTAPIGCVTEAGAKDANCDGVDDAAQSR